MFQLGLFAFAAVTGFLASTNNGALLQPTLFAIGGAIVVVLGIVQKFYIDRTTENHAAAMVPEVARQVEKISGAPVDLQLLAENVKKKLRPQGKYTFLAEQADTLGAVLISLSLGFAVGFGVGTAVRRTWPLLLTDRFAVNVPWTTSPPPDPLQAAGWMAVSERMSQAGVPNDTVRSMYQAALAASCANDAQKKDCESSKASIAELGRKWLDRSAPSSSAPPVAPAGTTGAAGATASDQVPALKPIVDAPKKK